MHTFQSRLISKKQLAPHIYVFRFSRESVPDFTFQAGQYVIFHVPQADSSTARRLYSIASAPSAAEAVDFVIEILPNGVGSRYLEQLTPGSVVTIQGPAGLFTLKETNTDIIFLATGTGIAPIRSMIHSFDISSFKFQVSLFWGLKYFKDTYFLDEFTDLAETHENVSLTICLSQEQNLDMVTPEKRSYFQLGRMTNTIDEIINKNPNKGSFYLCGGRHVVENIKNHLLTNGISKDRLHFEKF